MKNSNIKRIALTLGIALAAAIAFFAFQFFIRQASIPMAIIGAGILFVLISCLPICFFAADKFTERRERKSKGAESEADKK